MKDSRHRLFRLLPDEYVLIVSTIAITIFTRTFHLTYQSLWFDELYSMIIANPDNSFKTILQNIRTDFHPPFYYFLLNSVFQFIPYNDTTGRLISALIGISGVFLMFIYGRTMKDRRTGIIMAFLTSIFYYHIKYSQEIRMYILIFAFTVLITTVFINIIRRPGIKGYLLYFFFAIISVYTHYYAFFILFAHFLCLVHLAFTRKINIILIRNFAFIYIFFIIAYIPWIANIVSTGGRSHFMMRPDFWYFAEYLYEYTGKEPMTTLSVISVLFTFFVRNLLTRFRNKNSMGEEENLTLLILFYSLFSVFIVTYLVSYFKPILNKHSTIVALPFLIAILALEIGKLKKNAGIAVLLLLLTSNFINIGFINRFYVVNSKDNFRQITKSIDNAARLSGDYLVVSQMSSLYNYYFLQFGSQVKVINPNESRPEIILAKVDRFFVINAPFTEERGRKLEKINEMGFRILYPNLDNEAKHLQEHYYRWTEYIEANFIIDSSFNDKKKNFEVAFRYRKRTLSD